jgi:hypothetical protein
MASLAAAKKHLMLLGMPVGDLLLGWRLDDGPASIDTTTKVTTRIETCPSSFPIPLSLDAIRAFLVRIRCVIYILRSSAPLRHFSL